MRIAFLGTPEFSVPTLHALAAAGHEIAAVYTQPPRRAGRGKQLQPSAVQLAAETMGLDVRTPQSLRDPAEQTAFAALGADLGVVVAYGMILPQAVLDAPARGCLNVHASLLPRWRGAAPIQRAIEAGDAETGVTIMQMAAGLDTGPMLAKARTPIADKTGGELFAELAELGANLLADTVARLATLTPEPQDEALATYAAKIAKAEARIDWTRPAIDIERQVRALAPFPGAWFEVAGERVKLLKAEVVDASGAPGEVLNDALAVACGNGALRPLTLQRAGKPAMSAAEFLRGFAVPAGTKL